MEELIAQIKELQIAISEDIIKYEAGNKAAGRRVRVNSLKLQKLFLQFRKESVK